MDKCLNHYGNMVAEEGFEPRLPPGNVGPAASQRAAATLLQLLLLLIFAAPLHASDPWDMTDKVLYGSGLITSGADMISTHKFLKDGEHKEWNPVLGEYPSDGQLALYWAGLAVVHYLVADYLPSKWYGRKAYLFVVTVAHACAVRSNTIECRLTW